MEEDKTHLLLVEDDQGIRQSLSLILRLEGFKVSAVDSLNKAQKAIDRDVFDLILLDVMLPDGESFQFCYEFNAIYPHVPIIMLTAKINEASAVKGLASGATDYIRKPFGNRELLMRIRKTLKHTASYSPAKLTQGSLEIDKQTRYISFAGKPLQLSRREFDILLYMVSHLGRVITREEIIEQVVNREDIYDRTIDSHISHLRQKLKQASADAPRITSVYGLGYRLEEM